MLSITHFNQIKIFTASNLILFLLTMPKIDIFNIDGYHQGIRIENIFSLLMFLIILFNLRYFKVEKEINFYFICTFIFFSYLIGYINGSNIEFFSIIRLIEYIVFVIFFSNFILNYEKIFSFFKILLVINLIVSILQSQDIVGIISSIGYIEPDFSMWRVAGVFSGSWELSFISSVSYFLIYQKEKKKLNIYLIIVLIILYLAGNRGIYIAFFSSILFLYFEKFNLNSLNLKNFKSLSIFLILITLIIFASYYFILEFLKLDIFLLLKSLIRLIFFNELMFTIGHDLEPQYYSWAYRLLDWQNHAAGFNKNLITNLFGVGYTAIYYDSFFIRILFGNGLISFLILCLLSFKINFYMIIFLSLSSLSLDFIASFKMFIILFLYFRCRNYLNN